MEIRILKVGELETNCYLVSSDKKEVLIIDPGDEPDKIIREIETLNLKPVGIVNTHGHPDHTGANVELGRKYGVPIYIHQEDAHFLSPLNSILGRFLGYKTRASKIDQFVKDGDEIKAGNLVFKVLHTPGHSPGGICLFAEGVLFSGDTLFKEDVGRSDLYGGSNEKLWKSIKEKLFVLPENTLVYPGHGPATSIGEGKKHAA